MATTKKEKNPSVPKGCILRMCEDPVTGMVTVKGKKGCPPGYIERIKNKVMKEGMRFVDES